jgi:hypothetical protein
MENILLVLATSLLATIRTRRTRIHAIGTTGCTIRMNHDTRFHISETIEGNHMHFGECKDGRSVYGIVLIQFREKGMPANQWKKILTDFAESLYPSFGVAHDTGAEWNYWHPRSPYAIGFVDYLQDRDGVDWKINAWINGNQMVVLYVKNINEASYRNQEQFLDSLTFPRQII